MQEDPETSKKEVEEANNTNLQEVGNEMTYSQEANSFNEEPKPINGDTLKQNLHRSVGALTFLNKDKQLKAGSGVLISRDTFLTAAHNIFDQGSNVENSAFRLYFGADGEAEEYQQVEDWRYPEEFKTAKSSAKLPFDFAIIKLKKPVQFDQFLSLSLACEECLLKNNDETMLKVFGFPSFKGNFTASNPYDQYGKAIKLNQYGLAHKGRIKVVDTAWFKMGYDICTLPGQGGCPVVVEDSIIAVHLGSDKAQFKVGRVVDVGMLDSLCKWTEHLKAAPFYLQSRKVCSHVQKTMENMKFQLVLKEKGLQSVDLSEFANLLDLNLSSNSIESIDLSLCPRLKTINLSGNRLQFIDLSKNISLSHIDLSSNKLPEIDVKANMNLTYLNLRSNNLTQMDVRANIYLTQLWLSSNNLTQMDVRANIHLIKLWLSSNKLSQMNVKDNINLTILDLYSNKLSQIDVRANINLTRLQLTYNNITAVDISKNTRLQTLKLRSNRLERICLCVSENVSEKRYIDHGHFDFADQLSASCRVQLKCDGNGEKIRKKAYDIRYSWAVRYDDEQYNNRNGCTYKFQIL